MYITVEIECNGIDSAYRLKNVIKKLVIKNIDGNLIKALECIEVVKVD